MSSICSPCVYVCVRGCVSAGGRYFAEHVSTIWNQAHGAPTAISMTLPYAQETYENKDSFGENNPIVFFFFFIKKKLFERN